MRKIIKYLFRRLPIIGTYQRIKRCKLDGLNFFDYLKFRLLSKRGVVYWPKHKTNVVTNPQNIKLGVNCKIGSHGCYIQGSGNLVIGSYVRIAVNVGILSSNHSLDNHSQKKSYTTMIGDYCWIGMNSVVLPGVELGPRTVVAAGSVVTSSFPDGFCAIGGNPARFLKKINEDDFSPPTSAHEFVGYIPLDKFDEFKEKFLA